MNKIIICLICALVGASEDAHSTESFYNDAKLIFHALNPQHNSPELQGYDPARALEVTAMMLDEFVLQNSDLTTQMKDRLSNIQKSLSRARQHYLTCIEFVAASDTTREQEVALQLADDVKDLAKDQLAPSLLFAGGHYIISENGFLCGHTTTYHVSRQENGKLQFIINNTGTKSDTYHENVADRTNQLVYSDLEADELDEHFWKSVIQTNFNNPVSSNMLMISFYTSIETLLYKGTNKISGRPLKRQKAGICAWKSLSTWLHEAISPGRLKNDRNALDEIVYVRFKKFMFENMLANFNPPLSFKATIGKSSNNPEEFYVEDQATIDFMKSELRRKIQKLEEKIKFSL